MSVVVVVFGFFFFISFFSGVEGGGGDNSCHEVTGVSLAVYITKIAGAFWCFA